MPRRFVSYLVFAVLFWLCWGGCASPPTLVEGNTFFSKPLRLSVTKPEAWHFVTFQERKTARQGIESTNRHLNYLSYGNSVPAVLMTREPRDAAAVSAVISLDRYPLEDDRFTSAARVAGFIISDYRAIVPGVQVTAYPLVLKAGKTDFSYCRIKYSLTYADGTIVDYERQFWVWAFPLSATVMSAVCESRDRALFQPEIDQVARSVAFKR